MLKFIGTGSAFNTKLGNNSAYYKEGNQMLLIDCGSNTFHRIKESNLLEGVEHIHVLITHTHADHVGSLADLILYTYYSHGEFAKTKVTVYSPFDTKVDKVLELNGCVERVHHNLVLFGGEVRHQIEEMDISVLFFASKHVNELRSYSLEIEIKGDTIYYSGDIKSLDTVTIWSIESDVYSACYIDTCSQHYEGNVHLSLFNLHQSIRKENRDIIWCMHLDEKFEVELAKSLGFNVAEVEV